MPKRQDLKKILIIGAGPIIIGQACEFDYSGAQACKALREEGYFIILVNSNPATIMTDPEMADVTYIEPITWQVVEKIIAKERPDAILPTMGGQTALNCALDLDRHGVLTKYAVELIGASTHAIEKAEDRQKFKQAMNKIGLDSAFSDVAHSMEEALVVQQKIAEFNKNTGYPVVVRPSFTLGGTGGGIAYNKEEFEEICRRGLDLSPTRELLIEESLLGWKEYEMEVVRDANDNAIIVCSIENLDPMGVHTGDSITVAPAQTLTDKEYQIMRNASLAVLREVGVQTGGSNVQFATHPQTGRMIVIEMNPRVSRSSALASKATGFPIAKVAAKLAVGYTLDELKNDMSAGIIPASFEPSIDYVVTKIPRFAFEKFKQANPLLGTQMKSVGETMAMGRCFQESLQKALRSLEVDINGFSSQTTDLDLIIDEIKHPKGSRLLYVADAFRQGLTIEQVHQYTHIDIWFLTQIAEIIELETFVKTKYLKAPEKIPAIDLRFLKQKGFSDSRLAELMSVSEDIIRSQRHELKIRPVFKRVDTCAAEFVTDTAYMYATYDQFCEAKPTNNKKIMILGGGPNRIGQGIEFDYCCVHASLALREDGFETIMVNCNPETVSTDYDTSDRLYFEPLTLEDVLEVIHIEQPFGVIVQYGGQTPLKLALALEKSGVNIIGTSAHSIDLAEDREHFQKLLHNLKLRQPPNKTARTEQEALAMAQEIGYPLVVRPSYVLGGRAMEIVHHDAALERYMKDAVKVSHDSPVLLDRFLDDAIECDVDCISDGQEVWIGAVMQHIEQAGVHSGDSACSLPAYSLSQATIEEIKIQTKAMAMALKVVGLMNVQFAIRQIDGQDIIYVLEVNPRASRTVPFVSKAIGLPLAKIAARCMAGQSLSQQGITKEIIPPYFSVKEAVFPFAKFPGVDPILGPEMRSTGEVMGVGKTFGEALYKSQLAASSSLPDSGNVFISVTNRDKPYIVKVAQELVDLGYQLYATSGTAATLSTAGIVVHIVNKVKENRPHIVDLIKNGDIQLIFTTVDETASAIADSRSIRTSAIAARVSYYTTLSGMRAAVEGIKNATVEVYSVQELHKMCAQ
jgi:carbamoyl-phosphate synthase large subunit